MEKVVVVVVITHLSGFFGSGTRFDWVNLSEPRLVMASSEVNVSSALENLYRCGVRGRLATRVANKSLKSLVKGRSSSVMRKTFEDAWCILLATRREAFAGGVVVLFARSATCLEALLLGICVGICDADDADLARAGRCPLVKLVF